MYQMLFFSHGYGRIMFCSWRKMVFCCCCWNAVFYCLGRAWMCLGNRLIRLCPCGDRSTLKNYGCLIGVSVIIGFGRYFLCSILWIFRKLGFWFCTVSILHDRNWLFVWYICSDDAYLFPYSHLYHV